MRKYFWVGFRSYKVERIRETKFVIKFRYKKWGSMIDREVKMQFPNILKTQREKPLK